MGHRLFLVDQRCSDQVLADQETTNAMRIVLADDHINVRELVSTRLRREEDIQIVAEAGTSAESVQVTLAESPHVLLIDPMMHDEKGMEAVREIAYRRPETVIVVLTAFVDTAMQMTLHKLGITHILPKGIESHRLVASLREAVDAQPRSPSSPLHRVPFVPGSEMP